ncbi:hypothetical protein ACS0TY_005994 [Phlomoides rotata]
MELLSHRVEGSNLKGGDHIYSWRIGFSYSHHGIYVGGTRDKVVHFTRAKDLSCSSFSSSVSNRGFKKGERSGVTTSCLNCFIGNGSLYRFEYGVSKCVFIAKIRGGTCTTAKSDPPEAVIHRAMYLLRNGFVKYDLFTNNCEDFALYCKTGLLVYGHGQTDLGSSGQAASAVGVPVAAFLYLSLRLLIPSPVVFGAATALNYTLNRYVTDIGVRTDTCKVDVQNIAQLINVREMLRIFVKTERRRQQLLPNKSRFEIDKSQVNPKSERIRRRWILEIERRRQQLIVLMKDRGFFRDFKMI